MGVAPTEPLGYRATELTLVFNEFHSMCLTILNASPDTDSGALSTHQLFFLEILIVVLCGLTILHATKVRFITFEALIVGQSFHCVALKVVVEWVTRLLQPWLFVQVLEFCSFHTLFRNKFLKFEFLFDSLGYFWIAFAAYLLLALSTF